MEKLKKEASIGSCRIIKVDSFNFAVQTYSEFEGFDVEETTNEKGKVVNKRIKNGTFTYKWVDTGYYGHKLEYAIQSALFEACPKDVAVTKELLKVLLGDLFINIKDYFGIKDKKQLISTEDAELIVKKLKDDNDTANRKQISRASTKDRRETGSLNKEAKKSISKNIQLRTAPKVDTSLTKTVQSTFSKNLNNLKKSNTSLTRKRTPKTK